METARRFVSRRHLVGIHTLFQGEEKEVLVLVPDERVEQWYSAENRGLGVHPGEGTNYVPSNLVICQHINTLLPNKHV